MIKKDLVPILINSYENIDVFSAVIRCDDDDDDGDDDDGDDGDNDNPNQKLQNIIVFSAVILSDFTSFISSDRYFIDNFITVPIVMYLSSSMFFLFSQIFKIISIIFVYIYLCSGYW